MRHLSRDWNPSLTRAEGKEDSDDQTASSTREQHTRCMTLRANIVHAPLCTQGEEVFPLVLSFSFAIDSPPVASAEDMVLNLVYCSLVRPVVGLSVVCGVWCVGCRAQSAGFFQIKWGYRGQVGIVRGM